MYLIYPLTSQLYTALCKVTITYAGPVVTYKIIDPHNYLLMTLDGRMLRGLFEHKRLKSMNIRTSQGNIQTLAQLKHYECRLKILLDSKRQLIYYLNSTNINFKVWHLVL